MLRTQFDSFSIPPDTPQMPTRPAYRGQGFNQPSRPYGSSFLTRSYPPNQPLTMEQIEILQSNVGKLPRHPNTAEGHTLYRAQVVTWNKTYGLGTRVSFNNPFPLTPGTASVNSGECWTCGDPSHKRDQCTSIQPINPKEQVWRQLVNKYLNPCFASAINYVSYSQTPYYDYYYGNTATEVYGQGKEQGPEQNVTSKPTISSGVERHRSGRNSSCPQEDSIQT